MILYDKKVSDVNVVGGKGQGLLKLVSYGMNVPDFFVITAGTKISDKSFAAELDAYAAKLHCEKFAVRSSNVNEDGADTSYAGQFVTELNVSRENLYQAVLKVASSVSSRNSAYGAHFGAEASEMAIVVQEQIDANYSGVMFTTSPFATDKVLIEQVDGAGEQLVSGAVIPQKFELNKGEINNSALLSELARAGEYLEKQEGYSLDIEWAYKDKLYLLQMRPLTALDDKLPTIAKNDWSLYVYRDFCALVHSVQIKASEREIQQGLFGFSMPIVEGLLVNGREFYTSRNDTACNELWKTLDKGDFFQNFIRKLNLSVNRTKRRTSELIRGNFSGVDDKTLLKAYGKHITAYLNSYVPLMMRPDDYLQSELQRLWGEEQANTAISKVTALSRKTYYASEQVDFLKAIVSENVSEYLNKYVWIYNPLGKKLNPLTRKNFEMRSCRYTKEQAEERIGKIKSQQRTEVKIAREFLSKISDNEAKRILNLIVDFIGLRTYTAENSDRYFYYIRSKILSEIARRFSITEEKLMLLTFEEVMTLPSNTVPLHELSKRMRGSMTVFNNGNHATYYGGQTYSVLADLLPAPVLDAESTVRGEIACRGEVTAKVKIINNFDDTAKISDGEIVVTSMTTPELTVALERAAGIITDEGGVTCHAAIISREYGIPCLLGTEKATQVLHDGMLVKLDCIHGYFQVVEDEVT